eukprot:2219553-Prymnesium_polylepis.2
MPWALRKSTISEPRSDLTDSPSAPAPIGRSACTARQQGSTGSQKTMWLAPRTMRRSASPQPRATPSVIVRRSVSVASFDAESAAETPSSEPPRIRSGGGELASQASTLPRGAKSPMPELTSDAP